MNKQLFKLYKESDRGKSTIALFNPETEDVFAAVEAMANKANTEWGSHAVSNAICDIIDRMWMNFENKGGLPEGGLTRDSYKNFIEQFELEEPIINDDGTVTFPENDRMIYVKKDDFRRKADLTLALSIYLYFFHDYFKPMLLVQNHKLFQQNCEALGIELPPLPRSKDYREYCMHYYDICQAINEFQDNNDLSDAETCAAIYDFAVLCQPETQRSELPSPTNVWLTGASGDDFKFLDTLGDNGRGINPASIWACNERTRRGDIVVIYALAPRSHIHSIWRADTNGIFNPFDHYHCRTHVTDGTITPPITFKDLKNDPYFSNVPIVRKNLQGINGWELTAKDYSELLRMIKEHGGDTSKLPKLFDGAAVDFGVITNEHEVEENILIPMLEKLGYTEKDWTQQHQQKAGRKEKAIPDFVFFPHGEKHLENAPMIIEAKLDMSSMVDFNNAYRQALSYARMMRSSIFAICDKERIIVYRMSAEGSANRDNPIYENHWAAIFPDDSEWGRLKQIIGRETIKQLN